jgi:hypothetical protein
MHFDASGRMADGDGYYIQRARFSSAIPLEYAYAAWQALPNVDNSTIPDSMARFRHVTRDMLVAYCRNDCSDSRILPNVRGAGGTAAVMQLIFVQLRIPMLHQRS